MIIDTHAHYDDHAFDKDRKELLSGLLERGVANVINASAAARTIPKVLALAQYYDFVYAMAGLHPCEVYGCGDNTGSRVMEVYGREIDAECQAASMHGSGTGKVADSFGTVTGSGIVLPKTEDLDAALQVMNTNRSDNDEHAKLSQLANNSCMNTEEPCEDPKELERKAAGASADIEWVQTYNIIKIQEWLGEAFAAYDHDEIISPEWTASEREMKLLRAALTHPKVVAVGEIGLDYHYDDTNKPLQKKWFADQINLAKEFNKPVNIHSRDAAADTADLMKAENARDTGGIVHCFSYGKEMAAEFLDMGFMLGIGGVVTFKNSKKIKEVVSYMPLDRMVLETDCPYLAPSPYRGKRNDSGYISYAAQAIADIKGVTREQVIDITSQNARQVYKLG